MFVNPGLCQCFTLGLYYSLLCGQQTCQVPDWLFAANSLMDASGNPGLTYGVDKHLRVTAEGHRCKLAKPNN